MQDNTITHRLEAVNHVLQFPFPQQKGLPHIAKFLVYVYEYESKRNRMYISI